MTAKMPNWSKVKFATHAAPTSFTNVKHLALSNFAWSFIQFTCSSFASSFILFFFITMARDRDLSPTYNNHRQWVESLVDTPPPPKSRQQQSHFHSPTPADVFTEHVLRGSRSFAARSFRSRTS